MQDGKTEIICVMDCSGSMRSIADDAIGGFNSLIEQQAAGLEEGEEVLVSTFLFNTTSRALYQNVPVTEVSEMTRDTFVCTGGTALYDAVGEAMTSVGARLVRTADEDRPSKVIVCIVTDGQENSSREFSQQAVAEMISHQQDVYSWEFMFLAANIDADSTASALNIPKNAVLGYQATAKGTQEMYERMNEALYRGRRSQGASFEEAPSLEDIADVLNGGVEVPPLEAPTSEEEVPTPET